MNSARNLANLLADTALLEHIRGNDAEAIELVLDLLHQASTIDQHPFMVPYLVSFGIESLVLNRLFVIAPELQIEPTDQPPSSRPSQSRPVQRKVVKQLVLDLLDSSAKQSLLRALRSERVLQIDTMDWLSSRTYLFRPLLRLSVERGLSRTNLVLSAADKETNFESDQILRTLSSLESSLTFPLLGSQRKQRQALRYARMFDGLLTSPLDKLVVMSHRNTTERRLAAIALAIRLFRTDHHRWPDSLDELVPEYLPYVPRDPMARDAPLRFVLLKAALPDGSDRPVIYSVGEDGVDDTAGGWRSVELEPCFSGWRRGKRAPADQWRDVSRWAPGDQETFDGNRTTATSAPSTQAVDHQPDEAD